ncbi:MAG: glycoside hydrolase family 3 N-terminal domain-containing protein, partial [Bacteroidota bacterium]
NSCLMTSTSNIQERVESLIAQMTIAEKIGQMNQYNGFWESTGPQPMQRSPELKLEHLKEGYVGSLLNVRGVAQVRKLQQIAVNETRLGIPLIFGFDVIHGHKTLAPIPLAEAASWDLPAIEKSARVAATEAAAKGINWTFAPMVDISRDARWGRVMEGAGEDTYLGSLIAKARVQGFQGEDLAATDTVAACAKHFAAYGFAEAGRDYNTVDIGTVTLQNVVLPPFKAAVEAGVRTFMNGFNVLNGCPVTADQSLQRDLLKGQWGFDGFIVSDWASGAELVIHGLAEDLSQAAKLAVLAGSDMDMESYAYVPHLEELVKNGAIAEDLIDDAVRRILTVKFELGLFDDPFRYCDEEREETLIYHPDHHAAVLDMAKKSIVLLKNEGNLLPLSKKQQKIALIGALADDKTSPLGSWRIGSDDESAVSVLEGLAVYTDDFTYTKGADLITNEPDFIRELVINETDISGFKEACALAKSSEVVVMVLGEHGFQSGEGRCRTDLNLPGVQLDLLKQIHAINPNIVLVLMNGRPLTLNWEVE